MLDIKNLDKNLSNYHQKDENFSNVYIILGNEVLLIQETLNRLRLKVKERGYEHRISTSLDQRSKYAEIFNSISNISLFDEQYILEINIPTEKPNKQSIEKLIWLVKKVRENIYSKIILFIIFPKNDKSARSTLWMKELMDYGIVINIPTIKRKDLPNWVRGRLFDQKQTIHPELLQWIVDRVEGDLLAANNEILKLGLFCPKGQINDTIAREIIDDVAYYDIFEVGSAIFNGNVSRTIRILNRLREREEQISPIVWFLGEQIITAILHFEELKAKSQNTQTRIQKSFRYSDIMTEELLCKVKADIWTKAIHHIHEIELLVKGFGRGNRLKDPWDELIYLSIFFSRSISRNVSS